LKTNPAETTKRKGSHAVAYSYTVSKTEIKRKGSPFVAYSGTIGSCMYEGLGFESYLVCHAKNCAIVICYGRSQCLPAGLVGLLRLIFSIYFYHCFFNSKDQFIEPITLGRPPLVIISRVQYEKEDEMEGLK
jgi:hypothetical protein